MVEQSRMRVALSGAALVAAVALAGCGGSAAKSGGPAAGAGTSAASSGTAGGAGSASSSSDTFSSGAGAGSSTSTGAATKTCTAGHTQALINGKSKCLAPGQPCSAKAVSQYPRYGFVCATTNGKLVLRRK